MLKQACPDCEIELRPLQNDIRVAEMAVHGAMALWCADLWQCPSCGKKVILGYGAKVFARSGEPDFEDAIRRHSEAGDLYLVYLNAKERDQTKRQSHGLDETLDKALAEELASQKTEATTE